MVELNGATIRTSQLLSAPRETPDTTRTVGVFLVKDFDLRSGSVNVTVPDVAPGEYTITRKHLFIPPAMHHRCMLMSTVFGDSGNISPTFTIVEGSN